MNCAPPPRRLSLLATALLAAGCGPPPVDLHVRLESVTPAGTVPPGPVVVELAFSGALPADPAILLRRVALCRAADAEAVAAAAGAEAGLPAGAPVLAARLQLLDGRRRMRLTPERDLWPMAGWAVVVGKGLLDAEGRLVLDPLGRVRTARHDFQTGDLAPGALPRVVLTEAMARAAPPAAGGEYAEVANLGAAPADLAGFRLAKRTASGAVQRCVLEPASGGAIAPGGHALLAGGAWDGRLALPLGTPIHRCGAAALLGGLADDRPVALALESPGGLLLSSLGWLAEAPRCAQGALERIHPAGADAPANLACPGAVTPGQCNASTPAAECPGAAASGGP